MGRKQGRLRQHTFDELRWGGARPGAGRKKSKDSGMPHAKREDFRSLKVLHVTLRIASGLGSLRESKTFEAMRKVFATFREREGFRIVHFAVLRDHLHMIVEADSRECLGDAMRSFCARMARALNQVWGRRGNVFPQRFHEVLLETPRQVRNALCYVLNNARKHGLRLALGVMDPFSSADAFDGWTGFRLAMTRSEGLVAKARSWLLRTGWRRHGPLRVDDVPGTRREPVERGTRAAPPPPRPRSAKRDAPSERARRGGQALLPFAQAA